MELTSPTFANGAFLPYTCGYESENRSPALTWKAVPPGTESLALVCEDRQTVDTVPWTHWLLWNLSPCETGLAAGRPPYARLPEGAEQGYNDFLELGWGGPCPPTGVHSYHFTLHALDCRLSLQHRSRSEFEAAIRGHVLASAVLVGEYRSEQVLVSWQTLRGFRTHCY